MNLPNRVRINLCALREAASDKLSYIVTVHIAADMVLVSRRAWQRWENDGKSIPVGVIKRFCANTGLNPADWIAEVSE
jgi:hypothetical protein